MGYPVARQFDTHVCPMPWPGGAPHGPTPVLGPSVPTVLMGGMPCAVIGDTCACGASLVGSSKTVMAGNKFVVRAWPGDVSSHGGNVIVGFPQILVGG